MTLNLLVIQPTPFCNINCDYCYLPSRRDSSRMSTETLDIAMQRVFASGLVGTDLSVVWHAGEPLVLPVDYYRQAFSIIERYCSVDVYLRHSIQTNGILLTDKWCDFIREKQVNIGLSIDGPQWIHDVHRRTRNGKGTHTAAMKGLELLHKHDIPFHVICVLTKDSLPYPDEIFDFFVGCRVRQLGFNIEEIEGVHKTSSLDDENIEEIFERFFERIIQRLQDDPSGTRIREVDEVLMALRHPAFGTHISNSQNAPLNIISISWDGDFSTFSPELLGHNSPLYGSFSFGNVNSSGIRDIFYNERFQKVLKDIARGVSMCRKECKYFDFCRGGAPANKLAEDGTFASTETLFCRLTQKTVIECVLRALEKEIDTQRRCLRKLPRQVSHSY